MVIHFAVRLDILSRPRNNYEEAAYQAKVEKLIYRV